jgi:hypothetical protein
MWIISPWMWGYNFIYNFFVDPLRYIFIDENEVALGHTHRIGTIYAH